MTPTRKRARSLDEIIPPLTMQITVLRQLEESHHTDMVRKLSLVEEQLCESSRMSEPPSKRLRLNISDVNHPLPSTINASSLSPVHTHSPQFGIMMRGLVSSLLHTVIREASRKAASSKSSSSFHDWQLTVRRTIPMAWFTILDRPREFFPEIRPMIRLMIGCWIWTRY